MDEPRSSQSNRHPRAPSRAVRVLTVVAALVVGVGAWVSVLHPSSGTVGAVRMDQALAQIGTWEEGENQWATVTLESATAEVLATATLQGTAATEESHATATIEPSGEPPIHATVTLEPVTNDTPTPTASATRTPIPPGQQSPTPLPPSATYTSTPTRTHTPTPTPSPTPSSGTLANIATRGFVGTIDHILIGGFISRGAPSKVIIRGLGPSLGVPGALKDPLLRIFSGQTVIGENNNWQDGNCRAEAPEGLWPKDPREACLVMTLPPGPFTAHVLGADGGTGVGFFDLNKSGSAGEFANIATRGFVGTADNVLIGGLIIRDRPTKVIIRAIARSMGLPPTNVPGTLLDPMLQLFSGQTVIAQNDNWQTGNCGAEAPVSLHPKDPLEACLVITLPPGPYTAIVSGVGGTTGIGLVEVFKNSP